MIKKKIKKKFLYILLASFLLSLFNCNLKELAGDGIDAAEDSGFDLIIKNFSNTEYNNCTFYMGYKDTKNKFVALDSLVYKNIVIYKKGDGDNYNSENFFSLTYLSDQSKQGLNKYGMWEPNSEVSSTYFKNGEIYFKVKLKGNTSISSPIKNLNGFMFLEILENGSLFW